VKVVAVSQRVDVFPEREERRDALDQRLAALLAGFGLVVVPVPNVLGDALRDWLVALQPAAVVLSGGNDIGQYPERDETEYTLLTYARERHKPVLGICRGMQMMALWSGASLHPVIGHIKTRHQLTGFITANVNSYHGYSLSACPDGFDVLAHSEDGEIEAIRHCSLPWEGWMWHPERESSFAKLDLDRLRSLLV
jgi:gamma-glutamyl-gamma-aminobutyrate hydrolase PuuD